MGRRSDARCYLVTVVLLLAFALPGRARAEGSTSWCRGEWGGWQEVVASPASADLYNGLLWFGGAVGLSQGIDSEIRWSATNDFDTSARDAMRIGSLDGRAGANTASDALLALSFGIPAVAIGQVLFSRRDCRQAYDMTTDLAEAIGLTLLLTDATKLAAGRERPYGLECDGSAPPDASCESSNRARSFFSGHASMAATGAGLACSYSIKRRAWGSSLAARATPCALGAGLAVATAMMRVAGDKHWMSDVLVGLAVGGVVGYFDTWGPFDLLRFEVPTRSGIARGVVLPWTGGGVMGARVSMRF